MVPRGAANPQPRGSWALAAYLSQPWGTSRHLDDFPRGEKDGGLWGRQGGMLCTTKFGLCAVPSGEAEKFLGILDLHPPSLLGLSQAPPAGTACWRGFTPQGSELENTARSLPPPSLPRFWRVAVPRGLAAAHAGRVGDGAVPAHPGDFWGLPSGVRVCSLRSRERWHLRSDPTGEGGDGFQTAFCSPAVPRSREAIKQ